MVGSPYGDVSDASFDVEGGFSGFGATGGAAEAPGMLSPSSPPGRYEQRSSFSSSASRSGGVGVGIGNTNDARRASGSTGCHSYREYLQDIRRREEPLSYSWPPRSFQAVTSSRDLLATAPSSLALLGDASIGQLQGGAVASR